MENVHLVSFCSLPFDNQRAFVEKDIVKKYFTTYREQLENNSEGDNFEDLYEPELYYLWGKYDLCVISKIDDLEFPTRFFRYSEEGTDKSHGEMQNFDYRVNLCFNGLHGSYSKVKENSPKRYPYIAISHLKLNSAFLIGNLIKETIACFGTELDRSDVEFDFALSDTYSYHELSLILKSNSLKALKEIVLKVRELQFNSLNVKDDYVTASLFRKLVGDKYDEAKSIGNHIFESTMTTFGVNFDLFNSDTKSTAAPIKDRLKDETVSFYSKWNIKPGHTIFVTNILKQIKERNEKAFDKYEVVAGKGDILITKTQISGDNLADDFPEFLFKDEGSAGKLKSHVSETYTSVAFLDEHLARSVEIENGGSEHYEMHGMLKRFTLEKEIAGIKTRLKSLWVPKILVERILRIISNYNNAILSPDMYIFYVELYPYIKENFIGTIDNYHINIGDPNYPTYKLIRILEKSCDELETSFENRFYQSYWTSEMPESNTDFSGGIHNLISVYDSCYKAVNSFFRNKQTSPSFLYVKSESQVRASFDTLKVNYLYLIQPYNFCSICLHEALNFALDKFYLTNVAPDEATKNFIAEYADLLGQADVSFEIPFRIKNSATMFSGPKLFAPEAQCYKDLISLDSGLKYRLAQLVNSICLRYYINDLLNFSYLFSRDFKLFKEVSWNHFFQTSFIYDSPGKINHAYFLTFALRLALVKAADRGAAIEKNDLYDIYPEDRTLIEDLVNRYQLDMYKLVEGLRKIKDFRNWFDRFLDISKRGEIFFAIVDADKEKTFNAMFASYFAGEVSQENLSEKLKNPIELKNSFPLIYLSILRSYLTHMQGKIKFLDRSLSGNAVTDSATGKLYMDPLGGIFISGVDMRQKYLNERIRFYDLLFHVSSLYKFNYMSERIDNSLDKSTNMMAL